MPIFIDITLTGWFKSLCKKKLKIQPIGPTSLRDFRKKKQIPGGKRESDGKRKTLRKQKTASANKK